MRDEQNLCMVDGRTIEVVVYACWDSRASPYMRNNTVHGSSYCMAALNTTYEPSLASAMPCNLAISVSTFFSA
jgi:hypothetical protein